LRILKPPSTLFTPTPYGTQESWSIEPPGASQRDALDAAIQEHLVSIKRIRQSQVAETPLMTPSSLDEDAAKVIAHINETFEHWAALDETAQREAWQLETLRGLAQSEASASRADATIDTLRGEIASLVSKLHRRGYEESAAGHDGQVSSKSGSAYPAYLGGSASTRISNEAVKTLVQQFDPINIDYKTLISKYKKVIRMEQRSSYPTSHDHSVSDPLSAVGHAMFRATMTDDSTSASLGSVMSIGDARGDSSFDEGSPMHDDIGIEEQEMDISNQLPPRLTLDLNGFPRTHAAAIAQVHVHGHSHGHNSPTQQRHTPNSASAHHPPFQWPVPTLADEHAVAAMSMAHMEGLHIRAAAGY
jgi:hypothetical protein